MTEVIAVKPTVAPGLLDCTLRDGGYHVNWDFDNALVKRYLSAIQISGIDFIELGFRNAPANKYRGQYFYTPETTVEMAAEIFKGQIGVMIDAKDYLSQADPRMALRKAFSRSGDSPLSFIRIATNLDQLEESATLVEVLSNLGYRVWLNLMQVSEILPTELISAAVNGAKVMNLESIVFADTFGRLTPEAFSSLCRLFHEASPLQFGIHSHNNRGLALANALACVSEGATYLDATMAGMGRGPGNTETENLAAALELGTSGSSYQVNPLVSSAFIDFEPLKAQSDWGYSALYLESSRFSIHPSYPQELASGAWDRERQWQVMKDLGAWSERRQFKDISLVPTRVGSNNEVDFQTETYSNLGGSLLARRGRGQPVIVIGKGGQLNTHIDAIKQLVHQTSWVTLDVSLTGFGESLPGYGIMTRASMANLSSLGNAADHLFSAKDFGGVIFDSVECLSYELAANMKEVGGELIVYPRTLTGDEYVVLPDSCNGESNLNGEYALLCAFALNPSRIYLVGFDGSEGDLPSRKKLQKCITWISNQIEVISLTSTSFSVKEDSLYRLLTETS